MSFSLLSDLPFLDKLGRLCSVEFAQNALGERRGQTVVLFFFQS